jgi:hypothetical protein
MNNKIQIQIIIFFSALVITNSFINGITLRNNFLEILLISSYIFVPIDLIIYNKMWQFLKRF